MAKKVSRTYTLQLTIKVSTREDEDEMNHEKLQDGLQVCVIGGEKIAAEVTL